MRAVSDVGRWASALRRQIDLRHAQTQAQEPVALAVCGPHRDLFIEQLCQSGPPRPGCLLEALSPDDLAPPNGTIIQAIVYCPDSESPNGALLHIAELPYAVCIVRTGESTTDVGRLSTLPPSVRPVAGQRSVYSVRDFELSQFRKFLLPDIVRLYHPHEVALGAAIPAFRAAVTAKLTHDCAMTCLQIAAVSALADHVPLLGLLTGGIASAGDTIAITVLQMRMLLRIAAAHGKTPDITRLLELIPIVGGGYGWRTLAREASGFIPVAGIPIKAAIAYAGTLVVGQVASHYYETGLHMSASAIGAAYREASERAKTFVARANLFARRK
jgi:uncharacterized protein (DUF697 family)